MIPRPMTPSKVPHRIRHRLEYLPVRLLATLVGALPRLWARGIGLGFGYFTFLLYPRLRRVGRRNLDLAFPGTNADEKSRILRGVYMNLGRLFAEFCLFPRY